VTDEETALITGAGRGFGRGIALAFARGGMRVAVVARTATDLDETASVASSFGVEALPLPADVRDPEQVGAVVGEVQGRFGRIDVLVNCAGAPANETPFGELTWDGWRQTLDVDVRGAFNLCQRVLPLMSERRGGMILNVASSAAWAAYEQLVSYAPGKAALVAFSRCLDAYAAPSGVAVHCLCPTLTPETSLGRQAIEAHAEHFRVSPEDYIDRYVAKPLLTPQMVGEAAIKLADVRPGDVWLVAGSGLQRADVGGRPTEQPEPQPIAG
jgi:NAD(P)-dependent dehydrogenase (short-subunit alcohol dehydrogenase family)